MNMSQCVDGVDCDSDHAVVASAFPTRHRSSAVHSPLNASLLLNVGLFTVCSNSPCGFREYLCIMYTANRVNTASANKTTVCAKFIL